MRKLPYVLFSIGIIACKQNPEANTSQKFDSLIIDSTANTTGARNAIEIIDEDTVDFNEEDYGDPGFEGMRVNREDLAPAVKTFLSRLEASSINEIINGNFVIIERGHGVYPVYTFGSSANDLKNVPGIQQLIADTAVVNNLSVYNWSGTRCDIEFGMPDGVYYTDIDTKDLGLTYETETHQETIEKINAIQSNLKDKKGKEFIVKFTDEKGDNFTLDIYAYLQAGNMYIGAINKDDCNR